MLGPARGTSARSNCGGLLVAGGMDRVQLPEVLRRERWPGSASSARSGSSSDSVEGGVAELQWYSPPGPPAAACGPRRPCWYCRSTLAYALRDGVIGRGLPAEQRLRPAEEERLDVPRAQPAVSLAKTWQQTFSSLTWVPASEGNQHEARHIGLEEVTGCPAGGRFSRCRSAPHTSLTWPKAQGDGRIIVRHPHNRDESPRAEVPVRDRDLSTSLPAAGRPSTPLPMPCVSCVCLEPTAGRRSLHTPGAVACGQLLR